MSLFLLPASAFFPLYNTVYFNTGHSNRKQHDNEVGPVNSLAKLKYGGGREMKNPED